MAEKHGQEGERKETLALDSEKQKEFEEKVGKIKPKVTFTLFLMLKL